MIIRQLPALAIVAFIACSPSKPGGRTQKAADELVIGMDQEPDSLWPALSSMMAGTEIKDHIG
ncbi:MAG TPA: hypothetical protein EYP98_19230, partial [Planctomycetes bacterium]|nr:hypothetical protein [Planctomycetota bacterium]